MIRRIAFVLVLPVLLVLVAGLALHSAGRTVWTWLRTGVWLLPDQLPLTRFDRFTLRADSRIRLWLQEG